MGLVECKCPNCGAELQASNDREYWFCGFCGTKFLVQQATIVNHNNISVGIVNIYEGNNADEYISLMHRAETFIKLNEIQEAKKCLQEIMNKYPDRYEPYYLALQLAFEDEAFKRKLIHFDMLTLLKYYERIMAFCPENKKSSIQSFWEKQWAVIASQISTGEKCWAGALINSFYCSEEELPRIIEKCPTPLRKVYETGKRNAEILNQADLFYIDDYEGRKRGEMCFIPKNAMTTGGSYYFIFAFGKSIYIHDYFYDSGGNQFIETPDLIKCDPESIKKYSSIALEYAKQHDSQRQNRVQNGICINCYTKLEDKRLCRICPKCGKKYIAGLHYKI